MADRVEGGMQEQMTATPMAPADWVAALLQARQTILPKRLGAPGPDAAQLQAILAAAAHAPDHGCLLPWRFVLVPQDARAALAEVCAQALRRSEERRVGKECRSRWSP